MGEREADDLRARVGFWASKLKVRPRVVRIQHMTRKWGSCSTSGTLSLSTDLTREEYSFQDFVVAHELLHLRVPNHGKLFKALMTIHVPGWRTLDVYRRRQSSST
jgi:predicted metal-dependent hydrolase